VVQVLKAVDHNIKVEPVEVAGQGDKFMRMQGVAAAWNAGRVLVPAGPDERFPWRKEFLEELEDITGVGDEIDDQGDALTHLWNGKQPQGYKSPGHAGNRRI
jgi:predicted phage terminase large subunit-like protein